MRFILEDVGEAGAPSEFVLEDVGPPEMAPQTIFPKGGGPRQATQAEAEASGIQDMQTRLLAAQRAAEGKGFGEQAFEVGMKRAANNILGAGPVMLDALTFPMRSFNSLIDTGEFPEFRQKIRGVTPQPTVQGLASNIRGVQGVLQGGNFSQARDRARENIELNEAAAAKEAPGGTVAGEIGGDILSIVLARRVGGVGSARQKQEVAKQSAEKAKLGFRNFFRDQGKAIKGAAKRPVKKATEVALEAAALSAIKESDPVFMAAAGLLAGGSQLGGSLALKGITSLSGLAALGGSIVAWQAFKEFTPIGGSDFLIESAEEVISKATIAAGVGVAAATLGAGRLSGAKGFGAEFFQRVHDNFPKFSDSINTIIRGVPVSKISEQFAADIKSDTPTIGPVMEALAANPDAFTAKEYSRINAAIKRGDPKTELDRMLKNDQFRAKVGL